MERIKFYFNDLPLAKPFDELITYVANNSIQYHIAKKDSCYLKVAIDKYDRLNSIFYESQIVLRCDTDTALITTKRYVVTSFYSNAVA